MKRTIVVGVIWSVVALIAWLFLPAAVPVRLLGDAGSYSWRLIMTSDLGLLVAPGAGSDSMPHFMWFSGVRIGLIGGFVSFGVLVPILLLASIIIGIRSLSNLDNRQVRLPAVAITAIAGAVACSTGLLPFLVFSGYSVRAGVGAYVLVLAGLALMILSAEQNRYVPKALPPP